MRLAAVIAVSLLVVAAGELVAAMVTARLGIPLVRAEWAQPRSQLMVLLVLSGGAWVALLAGALLNAVHLSRGRGSGVIL
jgi:hypothetical protein